MTKPSAPEVERIAESYAEPEAVARSIYQDEGLLESH